MRLLTFLFFVVPSVALAQTDEYLIRQSRAESNKAISAHDTAAMARFWLNDVVVITSRSTTLNGIQENKNAFQREFQTKSDLNYVRTSNVIEIFADWNMASEYGTWKGYWKQNGVEIKVNGSFYAKWHRVGNTWKIKSELYTPLKCEGKSYCDTFEFAKEQSPIVIQNLYYPKAGNEQQVLETRQRASNIRKGLGLPVGRILIRTSESTSQPYVIWECEYPSLQAREDDLKAIDQSDDFRKVQDHMGTLLEKFDRAVFKVIK